MEKVETELAAQPNIVSVIDPVLFIKQTLLFGGKNPELPQDGQEVLDIVTDSETGEILPDFARVIPDNQAITIASTISTGEKRDLIDVIKQTTDSASFSDDTETTVAGYLLFREELTDNMVGGMTKMMIMAVILMLVILALVFRVQGFFAWRWLPLGVVFLGIIYAFGYMGLLNIPITMVTMGVFPLLIGLGVDYAIQFHNRYDEQSAKGESPIAATIDSVTHIGPAIGIAIITACLGFTALFFSPVPMIHDFALTLIIGVTECYLLSELFLMAMLYRRDRRNNHNQKIVPTKQDSNSTKQRGGIVERVLLRISPWVIKNPVIIISIALLLALAGLISDSHIDSVTDETKLFSPDSPAAKDLDTLMTLGSGLISTNLLIEGADVTDPRVLEWMLQIEKRVEDENPNLVVGTESLADMVALVNNGQIPQSSEQIRAILEYTPVQIKRNLITDDFTAANVIISHSQRDTLIFKGLVEHLKTEVIDHPDTIDVTVTGFTPLSVKAYKSLTSGREAMTAWGIVFVFFALLLLFRLKVLRALVAIIPIILVIGWSSLVMYLANITYTPLTATLGALIIGIGVEFTVLLMMRYYEELARGKKSREAMSTAIVQIGRAIIASGLTVIGGFAALLAADDFPVLSDFGKVTMINVFFALVATLLVLPPMIVRIDTWRERVAEAKLKLERLDFTSIRR